MMAKSKRRNAAGLLIGTVQRNDIKCTRASNAFTVT